MPKLLFIQYRPFGTVLNGGDQGTKKNLDADAWCRALYADDYMTPVKNWDLKNIRLVINGQASVAIEAILSK